MNKSEHSKVAEFLVRNVPPELVKGLTVLEKLQLPIHDKSSFERQLTEMSEQAEDESQRIAETLVGLFDAQDFPILSTENAFEKYWDKYQPFPVPFPEFFPPPELPDAPTDQPPICDVYARTFGAGTLAARCACRAYNEALGDGFRHLQAVVIGYFSGRRASRTGRCGV